MTIFRIRLRQELVYEIEAINEAAAWEMVETQEFDPADAVGFDEGDVIYVRPAD